MAESKEYKAKRIRKSGWYVLSLSFLASGGLLSSILYKMSLIETTCFKNKPVEVPGLGPMTIPGIGFLIGLAMVAHEVIIEFLKAIRK